MNDNGNNNNYGNNSNSNNQEILNDEFFNAFLPSKKITEKKKKINDLIINLKQNKIYLSSLLSINNRQKLSKLYELILSNLTENNNNFVLSQLELIEILGQYLYDQNEYKSFYKQALPKLFDKFYLQNQKINDNIIQMFNNSIANRILSVEDYYPQIENIALEEDEDYKVIVLNFFYNQVLTNDNLIFEKIPKNIMDIISNSVHDQNSDISEISLKLMKILEDKKNELYKNNDDNLNGENNPNNNNFNSDNEDKPNDIKDKSEDSIEAHTVNFDDYIQNANIITQRNSNNFQNNEEANNNNYELQNENGNNNFNREEINSNNYNSGEEDNNNNNNYNDNVKKKSNYNSNYNSDDENQNTNKNFNNNRINSDDENQKINDNFNSDEENQNANKNYNSNFNSDDENQNNKNNYNSNFNSHDENQNINKNNNFNSDDENQNNNNDRSNRSNSDEENNNYDNNQRNNNNNNEDANSSYDNVLEEKNNQNKIKFESDNENSENQERENENENENDGERNNNKRNNDDEEDIQNRNVKEENMENSQNGRARLNNGNNNKKFNYRSRINRSRKLGIIKKNKIENDEKNKDDNDDDDRDNNNTNTNTNTNNKTTKNRIKRNVGRKNSENSVENEENNEKKPVNFDDMPIKGMVNNDNLNEKEKEPKKNIINIDDLPIKGMANYDTYKNNSAPKQDVEPETKNKNIINIDDLPIKGVANYNYNSEANRPKDTKKPNIINIDDLPIKGVVNYNSNNNNEIKSPNRAENNQSEAQDDDNNNLNKKKSVMIEIDFSDGPKNNAKKNRINRKFMEKNSKKIKKDPFENFEVQVKAPPPKAEEEKMEAPTQNNNFGSNYNDNYMTKEEQIKIRQKPTEDLEKKIEREMEKEKEREKEKEKEIEKDKEKDKEKEVKDDMRFESIKLILGEEIVEFISSSKWEEKKQGYELILNLIDKNIIEANYINDLYDYIKFKLKGFKETNFNINREALNIFIAITKKGIMPKKLLNSLIMAYSEKIADIKLKDNIVELINLNVQKNGTEIIQDLIKKLLKKSNPKLLIEYANLFGKIITDNQNISNSMPNKELIDYSKYMANNSNSQVRTASTNLICILYKTYGLSIRTAIKDIKESTLKIIEAELDKIELSPELKEIGDSNAQSKKGQTQLNMAEDNNEKELENKDAAGPSVPQDISKKITKEILKDIDEGKWVEKREGVEKLEKIILETNMKILPNGLNELFDLIKLKLSDCNKNLVKILISLLGKLIESLKLGFKNYTKNIALSLIPNLADKSLVIRNECLNCFDKWVENTGLETLIVYFPQFLKTENIESRIEIMKFIQKYHNNINKSVGEYVYKELVDPLLICLQDRTNSVRTKAEETIKLSFDFVPVDLYYKKIKDFKPAIAEDLKQIMNKIETTNYNALNEVSDDINNNLKSGMKKKNNSAEKNSNPKKSIKNKKDVVKNLKDIPNGNSNQNQQQKKEKEKDANKKTKDNKNKKKNVNINNENEKEEFEDDVIDEEENGEEQSEEKEENEIGDNDDVNENENKKGKKKKIQNEEKSFNSEGVSDSNENEDHNEDNVIDNENDNDELGIKKITNKNSKKNNIKVNKLRSKKSMNIDKKPHKKKISNADLASTSRKQSEMQIDEYGNVMGKSKHSESFKRSKNKNNNNISTIQKTRNNKYKESINDKNAHLNLNNKNAFNNKSISVTKFNSDARKMLSKSSAKKKLQVGKSKQVIDIKTKKALLFQDDLNGNNDPNNTQRMLSNSVHLRNNNKSGMRRTKSVEKKNPKRKNVLTKYSKVFLMNNRLTLNKNKRYELDKKYKFNLNTLTKDDFKNIKETSEKLFTEEFLRKMINQDFVKQLEALKEMKDNLDKKENIQVYFDNLDIILKLVSMKTYNNVNPALTKGLCEFFESLYNSVNEHDYNMTDIEINMVLALLMEKLQINNYEIKTQVIHLMKLYISLFDIYKIIMQILNMTLISNNKIKAGILEFILDLNENENLDICNKNFMRIFALFLHCNDNDVKIRLLELFRNIYDNIGDELWNLNDIITPKEKNYLKNNLFKDGPNNNNNRQRNINPNENEEEGEENENENYEENENDENGDNYEEEYNEENEDNYDEEDQYENPALINKNNMNNINVHNNRYAQNVQNMQNNPIIHSVNNLSNNRGSNLKNPTKVNRVYDNQYEKYEKDEINNDDNNENDENIGDENTYYNNLQNNNDSDTFMKFNESSHNTFENNNQINMQNSRVIKDRNETAAQKQNNVASNISKVLNILKKSKNNSTKSKLNKVTPIPNNNNPKKTYNNTTIKDMNLEENANDNNNNNINVNRGKNNKSLEQRPKIGNKLLSTTSSNEGITSEKELLKIMNSLSSEDESEKINSIIIVHEILCTKYQENKYILIPNIDNIISIFIKITHNLFDAENIENISAKFAKYLVTILCKIAANKELITHMTYKVLNELIYELLTYLLISNLDKIGENQEGNIIFKSLNSAMLRILENCDTTSVILVLLEIIKQNQIKEDDYNLSNLAIKCLIKITQNLKEYINNIQFDKILLQMHLILINYDKNINKMEIKTQTDIMTVKFIKNFIIDVVKIKRERVLQDYNNLIQNHKFKDKHIYAWIKNTLLMIRNMKENKQIISDNISKSTINKTSYNEEFDNDNEPSDRNQSSRYNNSENRINDNMPSITEENGGEKDSNMNNSNLGNKINNNNSNNLNKSTNINPNVNKMNKVNSKKININKNSNNENKGSFKEDYMNIIERIKLLKQNLKDNNNSNIINSNNNSTQIKRKKSIEINKKNKKK